MPTVNSDSFYRTQHTLQFLNQCNMDKKKLAAEACKAIVTSDIAVSVFELINEYHGYPPILTIKGNVFLVEFDAETEAFDDNGFGSTGIK